MLIVDDEQYVRTYIKAILVREGARLIEANDGIEALEIVRQCGGALDLVVTDLQMPRCGGLELAESMEILFPRVPILLMSAFADVNPREKVMQRCGFIPKPFTPQNLVQAIQDLLDLDLNS